jgi:putative radical SAM enzyme (TIGR03279 family)
MYEFAVAPAVTSIRRRGVEIADVTPASLGAELELEPGDRIIKINGRLVRDYLDFRFQVAGETQLAIQIRKKTGEHWELEIERDEGEDFGLDFEQIVPRQCANECIFCFCKGNPNDARPSLFIRDEDVRLSFLYGNYTTLTSITEEEMQRIIEQRLSPQYVSVHATDLSVRAYLLGVAEHRADISAKMERLLAAGIELHAQVVLCPGINDGAILKKTIADLANGYPGIRSVAIVPLGLTRYNTDSRLTPVTPEFCCDIIREIAPVQKELRKRFGTNFAFLGDEIYLRAGSDVPGRQAHGDYPQIEDGVGMVRTFIGDFASLLKKMKRTKQRSENLYGTILTGTLFAPVLRTLIETLNIATGMRLEVQAVANGYFGGDVSVAGLLTGHDLLSAKNELRGEFVIIPRQTLKSDEAIFLDGLTLAELQREINLPVHAFDFRAFADFVLQVTAAAEQQVSTTTR